MAEPRVLNERSVEEEIDVTKGDASLLVRAWRALKAFDEALDHSAYDVVLTRLRSLEIEMQRFKQAANVADPGE